jgi:hypothetical protein
VRYRYYVSHRLVTDGRRSAPEGGRIPANDLERSVVDTLLQFLTDPPRLLGRQGDTGALPTSLPEQHRLIRAAQALADGWPQLSPAEGRALLHRLLTRVRCHRRGDHPSA